MGCVIARKFDSKGDAGSKFPGASGQLRCGSDVRIERHQSAFTAAGWLHLFNLCATAAIFEIMFLFKGLAVERSSKLGGPIAA
jgi:hypothetical protein